MPLSEPKYLLLSAPHCRLGRKIILIGEASELMADTLENKLARLERLRLVVKKREVDKRIKEFDRRLCDLGEELAQEHCKFDAINLTDQLSQFIELSQTYAEILEMASEQNQENVNLIRDICSKIETRKRESTKAMKLFTSLMRKRIPAERN